MALDKGNGRKPFDLRPLRLDKSLEHTAGVRALFRLVCCRYSVPSSNSLS
jgi:hypothetical protein